MALGRFISITIPKAIWGRKKRIAPVLSFDVDAKVRVENRRYRPIGGVRVGQRLGQDPSSCDFRELPDQIRSLTYD